MSYQYKDFTFGLFHYQLTREIERELKIGRIS